MTGLLEQARQMPRSSSECLCRSSIQARNLVQKRYAFEGSGWPPAKGTEEKEAKPLRSEINEAVKLNVPAFAKPC
jgi:hypothetical protein